MSGKISIPATIASVVLLALPALGLAALPKKGSLLEGTLHDSGVTALTKPVDLKVAPTGKTARFTWWCGKQQTLSNRYSITVAIKADGTFAGTNNVGSLTVWTVKGRFLSPTSARASLRLISICDAKGGLVTLKSAS
ncbi:MAG: hypothetical protein H0V40_10090 [Actinobacteria bacterium]|nr:hypothetical protein [Actinomycetota bacterium]